MRVYTTQELEAERGPMGFLILLYGPTGVGKSVTTIQTADQPILYVCCESRDPRKFLKEAARPGLDIDFVFYETFDEIMEFFANPANFARYRTIVIDSITFLTLGVSREIEDEGYAALDKKRDIDKPLTIKGKQSVEGYGALGNHMLRFTNLTGLLTQQGQDVIMLALMDENPSYKRDFNAAPLLEGKKFGKNLPGFCDMIGMVESRLSETGEVVYPPRVLFDGDEWFMHKKYGSITAGTLHLGKILAKARTIEPEMKERRKRGEHARVDGGTDSDGQEG